MLFLENIKLSRPATHDLMSNMLKTIKAELKSILIHDMKDSTFYAQLIINSGGKEYTIDSRPSDAVALALRTDVPIHVSEQVMFSSSIPIDQSKDEEESAEFKNFIESVKPSDFFKS